jgi:ABC-type dipeptide/oligopeptide/nickel transport system permease component
VDDLTILPAPVFWATLLATLVPFITALLTRLDASRALKATVASGLATLDAGLVMWKQVADSGQDLSLPTLVAAIVGAIAWQRVVHAQANEPYGINKHLLPEAGLP